PDRGGHGAGGREEPVLARGGGQPARGRAEDEPALHVTRDETVELEGDGQPVSGRPRQMGRGDELGEGGWTSLKGAENRGGLVKDADSARVVHVAILTSHSLRCKPVAHTARTDRQELGRTPRAPEVDRGTSGTLAEKVRNAHRVRKRSDGAPDRLYIAIHRPH